jgi:hypothetical protein
MVERMRNVSLAEFKKHNETPTELKKHSRLLQLLRVEVFKVR